MAGTTTDLQREIDAYMRQYPLMTYTVDPNEEIASLKGELDATRDALRLAQRTAATTKAERDVALMERDMALNALLAFVEKAVNAPAPAEEEPAVRAVKVMQAQGVR